MKRMASSFLTLALVLAGSGQAKADLITWSGQIWQSGDNGNYYNGSSTPNFGSNTPPTGDSLNVLKAAFNATVAQTASVGLLSGVAADATFTTTSINYNPGDMSPGPYTPTDFFGPIGGFTGLSTNWNNDAAGTNGGKFGADGTLNNTYVLLTSGTVTLVDGATFTLTHDDGAQLAFGSSLELATVIGGTATPTAADTETLTYHGSTISTTLYLSYGEVNGPPAVLSLGVSPDVTSTPEPATLTMAGFGLVALGGYKLIRRRKRVVA